MKNTPFDFNYSGELGEKLKSNHPQIVMFGGIDHNFVLKGNGYRKVAEGVAELVQYVFDGKENKYVVPLS